MGTPATYLLVACFVGMMAGCYLALCARYLFTGTMPEFLS